MIKLYFEYIFTHYCWGIQENELSGEYRGELDVAEGTKFNIKYQGYSYFKVENGFLRLYKNYADGDRITAEFALEKGKKTPFYFEEDYESFTDLITGEFEGKVRIL